MQMDNLYILQECKWLQSTKGDIVKCIISVLILMYMQECLFICML